MNVNRSLKLQKYIIFGRKTTVHNIEGDDKTKLITEVYKLKPNTIDSSGGWREYEKCYYREIIGGRGIDVELQEGMSFISVDGTAGDFIDFNFANSDLETHEIKSIRTFKNKNFIKRERKTSFHEEWDVGIDANGNVKANQVGGTNFNPASAPKATADFSTIPAGTKYLYSRQNTPDGECIMITDVGYWLKNDCMNDQMLDDMSDSLDNLAPAGWSEIMENIIEPNDGDFDALEKALQADLEWNEDVNFTKFCS